jgi:hydrogenase large subunit
MATIESPQEQKVTVKEMSWDPVTRIVGSLGIHTEIDFTNQQVLKCYSTSMLFRGFDIFMRGIDPRTSSPAASAASAVTTTARARA